MTPVPLVRTTKALADENRIRILGALRFHELCVCQLIELLGLAPSTVSKHLSILRNARLVDSRKQGRWMYYRLSGDDVPDLVTEALTWILSSLAESPKAIGNPSDPSLTWHELIVDIYNHIYS